MIKYLLWMGLTITIAVCAIGLSQKAHATEDDYIEGTLLYSTLDKGEMELEYKISYGRNRDSNEHFYGNTFEMEYGITEHFMIEGEVEFKHTSEEGTVFDEGELEMRYRFLEQGELPVDIAISGKLKTESEEEGELEHALELRLILSKDIDKLNLTLNLPVDIPLQEGSAEFTPSLGISYAFTKMLRVGSELKYNVETHEGSVIPQIWFFLPLPYKPLVQLGFAHGFNDNHEDFGRMVIEFEFD